MPQNTPVFKQTPKPEKVSDADLINLFQKCLDALVQRARAGVRNLADYTFMLNMEGHPMSVARFPMFHEMFDSLPVLSEIWLTARQVGKTFQGVAADIVERLSRSGTRSLIVTPLFSQAARISKEITAPMLANSMFRDEIVTLASKQTVLRRTYCNQSTDTYSYALLDVLRIRGITGIDRLWVDEIQGVREDILPIIEQTQAARPYTGWKRYTGTPLSTGNLAEVLWQKSSQGEQVIRCGCGKWNIGAVDHDLLNMIGPLCPICVKCGKPLDIMKQIFVPRYREREEEFRGRHISQVLHPLHACIPLQWRKLRKLMADPQFPKYQLYNEVLGLSFDSADRMIDKPTLQAVCDLGPNTLEEARKKRRELSICGIGIDWGGGGDTHSWTKLVFGGIKSGTSDLHVHHMLSLPQSMNPAAQAAEVLKLISIYNPAIFAHDYTGAGWLFETLGFGQDLDPHIVWPFTYGYSPNREVVYANVAEKGSRASLHLDHTRSLFAMFTAIRGGKIRFPDYDMQRMQDSYARPVDDFLAVFAERRPSVRGGDILTVKRDPGHSDDFAHATNFLATACWYRVGSYPSVPDTSNGSRLSHTQEELEQMDGQWVLPERETYEDSGPYTA